MKKICNHLFLQTIAGYLILTLMLPPTAFALRPMGTENQETIQKIRSGLEEDAAVPTVTRVPFGDWGKSLNRWFGQEGVIQKETEHLGEGEIWIRLVLMDERIPIVEALVDGEWVSRQPEMQEFIYPSAFALTGGFDGRPLVHLVVNRYRSDEGWESLLIERVQILRGPQKLQHGEELEIRSELVERIGDWGAENNIPVYLIRPEVMRDANPELREITLHRNYYEPVDQRKPRLWDTVPLRVIGSGFLTSDDQTGPWFLYVGKEGAPPAVGSSTELRTGLEELDQDIEELSREGRRIFPEEEYGWGDAIRHPDTRIVPSTYFPLRPMDVPTLEVRVSRDRIPAGRYSLGYNCFECSHWLARRLRERGHAAHLVSLKTPLWDFDVGVEVAGRLVSLTPGTDPTHPSVTLQERMDPEEVESEWERTGKVLFQADESLKPLGWKQSGEVQILLAGGMILDRYRGKTIQLYPLGPEEPLRIVLRATLVRAGVPIQTAEIEFIRPLKQLADVQAKLQGKSPEEVAAVLGLKARLLSQTSDISLPNREQQFLEAYVTQQADLFYHFLTKLDPAWVASFTAGLEEVVPIGVNGLKFTDEKFRRAGGLRDY